NQTDLREDRRPALAVTFHLQSRLEAFHNLLAIWRSGGGEKFLQALLEFIIWRFEKRLPHRSVKFDRRQISMLKHVGERHCHRRRTRNGGEDPPACGGGVLTPAGKHSFRQRVAVQLSQGSRGGGLDFSELFGLQQIE